MISPGGDENDQSSAPVSPSSRDQLAAVPQAEDPPFHELEARQAWTGGFRAFGRIGGVGERVGPIGRPCRPSTRRTATGRSPARARARRSGGASPRSTCPRGTRPRRPAPRDPTAHRGAPVSGSSRRSPVFSTRKTRPESSDGATPQATSVCTGWLSRGCQCHRLKSGNGVGGSRTLGDDRRDTAAAPARPPASSATVAAAAPGRPVLSWETAPAARGNCRAPRPEAASPRRHAPAAREQERGDRRRRDDSADVCRCGWLRRAARSCS